MEHTFSIFNLKPMRAPREKHRESHLVAQHLSTLQVNTLLASSSENDDRRVEPLRWASSFSFSRQGVHPA
jgi:hypothetical protein